MSEISKTEKSKVKILGKTPAYFKREKKREKPDREAYKNKMVRKWKNWQSWYDGT